MKDFNIYEHPTGKLVAVKQGFSWPSLFFGIFWLAAKKLWKWFAIVLTFVFFSTLVEITFGQTQPYDTGLSLFVSLLFNIVSLVIWIYIAYNGNKFREQNLKNKGYILKMEFVVGKNPSDALSRFLLSKDQGAVT